jgi:SAM-dependent methyltransferase
MPAGFKRAALEGRYNVASMREDEWHTYSGSRTQKVIEHEFADKTLEPPWLLNAGAGVYDLGIGTFDEISLDLFTSPIRGRAYPVCANIQHLPLRSSSVGGVVCVGEVLAYCDPALTIAEFARVLGPSGLLVCDFGSSLSFRHWFRESYGRAADIVMDHYNGAPERTWVYSPKYIRALLASSGFRIVKIVGTHTWSAISRRLGLSTHASLALQRKLEAIHLPSGFADVITIVAVREKA